MHRQSTEVVLAGVTVLLFVGALALATSYAPLLESLGVYYGANGMLAYVAVTALAVVAAPLSAMPLLPLATASWGPGIAALLSILGWTIGAVLAFLLARTLGRRVIARFVSLEHAERVAQRIIGTNVFVAVLLLRMVVPVDVLSYAVGLFVPIRFGAYVLATIIGVTPFAFVFAYALDTMPLYAVVTTLGALLVLVYVYRRLRRRTVR